MVLQFTCNIGLEQLTNAIVKNDAIEVRDMRAHQVPLIVEEVIRRCCKRIFPFPKRCQEGIAEKSKHPRLGEVESMK